MDEENIEEQETSINPDEETETSENTEEEETSEKNEELEKAKELANNQKIRAEKAEKKAKELKSQLKTADKDELSSDDIITLAKADINDDQLARVRQWAKFKDISIKEALNDPIMKTSFAQDEIEARNAEASNVKGKSGDSKRDTELLKQQAVKGELPESDEDIAALADH